MIKNSFPVYSINEVYPEKSSVSYEKIAGQLTREKLHRNDYFLVLFVETGRGNHFIDFVRYPVRKDQIHLIFPEQIHAMELNAEADVHKLLISRKTFRSCVEHFKFIYSLYQKYPVVSLSPPGSEKIAYVMQEIQRELLHQTANYEIIEAHLFILIEVLNRELFHYLQDSCGYKSPLLFEFLSLVNIYYKEHKSISFYTDKMSITMNYLNKLCQERFTCTATEIIQNRVILEAKKFLLTEKQSIKEIADGLGYEDFSYFSRFFKSMTGATPKDFKMFSTHE